MNETFLNILTVFGGLAIFIYGMNLMSDGLQKSAGDKMRKILGMLTVNPLVGVLAGALVTAILQSSSATTVMVIGFVSAGLMKLPQAISVILGANIGTTITAQLVAFKVGDLAWAFVIVGFVLFFFFKGKGIIQYAGQAIFGFGLLFTGINTMSSVMKPLAEHAVFADMITNVAHIPVLGVLVGAGMTALIQSSSATIAVLQNLASTPAADGISSIIGLKGAIPILFGDNIGTTITAILASIGQSINAKRTAVAHVIFNLSGTLLFIWFVPYIANLIQSISGDGPEYLLIAREIANTHTLFNITTTLIWLPFVWFLAKLVTKIIPDKNVSRLPDEPKYIDYNIIDQATFAIYLATKELGRNAKYALEMVQKCKPAILSDDEKVVEEIYTIETYVNTLDEATSKYLASILSSESLTETQSARVSGLLHISSDIEHIGDHCKNLAEFTKEKIKRKLKFSEEANKEVYECLNTATEMVSDSISALENGDGNIANAILSKEEVLNEMEKQLRKKHISRLNKKECTPDLTVIYTDIIHNIEKIGDYCKNIALSVLDDVHFNHDHEEFDKMIEDKDFNKTKK
ncbi:MAG: Na/Pi cotransporter family protein [Anaerovoracaceae bacterium]